MQLYSSSSVSYYPYGQSLSCHFCQNQKAKSQYNGYNNKFYAQCCKKACLRSYCLQCIIKYFDQNFQQQKYKKQTWICYSCQKRCGCTKCLNIVKDKFQDNKMMILKEGKFAKASSREEKLKRGDDEEFTLQKEKSSLNREKTKKNKKSVQFNIPSSSLAINAQNYLNNSFNNQQQKSSFSSSRFQSNNKQFNSNSEHNKKFQEDQQSQQFLPKNYNAIKQKAFGFFQKQQHKQQREQREQRGQREHRQQRDHIQQREYRQQREHIQQRENQQQQREQIQQKEQIQLRQQRQQRQHRQQQMEYRQQIQERQNRQQSSRGQIQQFNTTSTYSNNNNNVPQQPSSLFYNFRDQSPIQQSSMMISEKKSRSIIKSKKQRNFINLNYMTNSVLGFGGHKLDNARIPPYLQSILKRKQVFRDFMMKHSNKSYDELMKQEETKRKSQRASGEIFEIQVENKQKQNKFSIKISSDSKPNQTNFISPALINSNNLASSPNSRQQKYNLSSSPSHSYNSQNNLIGPQTPSFMPLKQPSLSQLPASDMKISSISLNLFNERLKEYEMEESDEIQLL